MTSSAHLQIQCTTCSFKELCFPACETSALFDKLDSVIRQSRRLRKGEFLFHVGEKFHSIYAIRTGYFKTSVNTSDGLDQVTGCFMSGEMLGLDGISVGEYTTDAVALEDSEVCELPFHRLEELGKHLPGLHMHFYHLMSRELVRLQSLMLLLGNMRAEERLAAFLLNLSRRLQCRGYASNEFILRMSREEIGSYLGLKLETVSRTLSKFSQEGWIEVEHKHIKILNFPALHQLIASYENKNEE